MDEVGTTDIPEEVVGTQEIEVAEEPWSMTLEELQNLGVTPWWKAQQSRSSIDDLLPPKPAPTSDYTMSFTGSIIADPITITKLKSMYKAGNPASLDSFRGAGPGTPTTRPVQMSAFRGLSNKIVFNGTFYLDRWDDLNIQYPSNSGGLYENPNYSWNNKEGNWIGKDASHFSQYRGIFANQWLMAAWCGNNPSKVESIKALTIKNTGRHGEDSAGTKTSLDFYMSGLSDDGNSLLDISSKMYTRSEGFSPHFVTTERKVRYEYPGGTMYSYVYGSTNNDKEKNIAKFISSGFLMRFQAQRSGTVDPRPGQTEIIVEDLVIDTSK